MILNLGNRLTNRIVSDVRQHAGYDQLDETAGFSAMAAALGNRIRARGRFERNRSAWRCVHGGSGSLAETRTAMRALCQRVETGSTRPLGVSRPGIRGRTAGRSEEG